GGATIELFANHTPVTTETSAADGNAYLRFPYRLGTLLVVTATRQGYVPNSAPWRPTRLPVFSSLSLELLPERAATLMVYEDLIHINSGSQGERESVYLDTVPGPERERVLRHCPWPRERALSVGLMRGVELQVNCPISISISLPANCGLKENQHIPAWRFDPSLGAWLKSSLGYVQREGDQLSLTYIAPQLGYWVAAMSPLDTGTNTHHDISAYHTVFLLAILGGMAVILLCLLCLLLYYCRRGCVKPRLSQRKLTLSSGLEGSKRDQSTSMSHLITLSAGTDAGYRQSYTSICSSINQLPDRLSSSNQVQASASQLSGVGEGGTSVREATSPCSPPVSPIRGEGCERRPPDYLLSRSVDHLGSLPLSLPRPGQLLCCGSVDLLSGGDGYPRRIRPTLVIPAHYMRLPGEHPLCGQALFLQTDQQSDLETIQAELNASHSQQPLGQTHADYAIASANQGQGEGQGEWSSLSESLSIPTALGESGIMQMNGEDTLLAERKLMELRGGKPLTHPRAWFVSLDGRSNAIRHSYIDLQRAGGGRHVNGNDASLDSGVDLNEPRAGRRGREVERKVGEREREKDRERGRTKSGPPAMAYTQLVYVDDLEGETPECSPQDSPLGPGMQNTQGHQQVEEEEEDRGEEEEHRGEGMIQEEAPSPLSSPSSSSSSPPPLTETEGMVFRTEHDQPALLSVAPDDHGEEEEKKSPWQKREERPLLAVFNLK
uniref:Family with sequence similarity 171 member A1 n=1 Tax=Oncorhynchus kisutch TaxID=8019 RepID=A0A8C7DG38_ONCKI